MRTFARTAALAIALVGLSTALIADSAPALARAAGAAGTGGAAAGGSAGATGGSSGGAGVDLAVFDRDPPIRYRPRHVLTRPSANSCWKATQVFDDEGNSFGTVARQKCYE